MTSPSTLPLPVVASPSAHEHAWLADSAHRTSEGEVVYVRCVRCAAHRVDVRVAPSNPPQALSLPTRG